GARRTIRGVIAHTLSRHVGAIAKQARPRGSGWLGTWAAVATPARAGSGGRFPVGAHHGTSRRRNGNAFARGGPRSNAIGIVLRERRPDVSRARCAFWLQVLAGA